MDIIKRGLDFTQTIKNVTRFREIISVFARNGLDEFVIKSGLHKVVPNFVLPKTRLSEAMEENSSASWARIIGYRLRKSFEELGPGFVKIGQLLSTREDIFPADFIVQMQYLRDQASDVPFETIVKSIEASLGCSSSEVFKKIDPKPIGKASIGIVYRAELKNGKEVVVKVRRPGINKIIDTDINIANYIISQVERVSEEVKYLGVSRLVQDFGSSLQTELDFNIEALNCKRLKENLEKLDAKKVFYIPKVYEEYTKEDLIVMEFLDGVPFSDSQRVKEKLPIIQKKLTEGLQVFIKTLLQDGFFHADLHGGNFFLLSQNKIGLVDFGLMGHLSKKSRSSLIVILYSLINHNYENLVYEFLDVAEYEEIPDVEGLIRDVRESLSMFVGLTVQQVNLPLLLHKTSSTLIRHKIYLPREWFIVFRALVTLDGVGKSLDMDVDIYALIEENMTDVVKDVFSKESLLEEGIMAGRDILSSMRTVPRHLRWFLRELSKNNYAFQIIHSGHEKPINDLKNSIIFFGHSLLAGVFLLSGVLVLNRVDSGLFYNIPQLSWIFWSIGFFILLWGMRQLKKN